MTYLNHIDDLDILQYSIHCAAQFKYIFAEQSLEETVVLHKLITIK